MDVQLMEIGVKVRAILMYTSSWCYRSVCSHPFLVGLLCFLICLNRSFPFVFSLLVSASPVLICTAVLLGTLLSFGQPNIPEIETEEGNKKAASYEAVLVKTGVSEDVIVVERSEGLSLERRDEVESSMDRVDLLEGGFGGEVGSDDTVPLIGGGEGSREVELEAGDGSELRRELEDSGDGGKAGWDEERHSEGEVVENHYAPIPVADDGRSSSDDEKSEADSFGSEKVNVDGLDSPPPSPWTRMASQEEGVGRRGDEGSDDADSGSDRAESSSPDASMADILPMLDELHPLLDCEAPRPAHDDDSDAASEGSIKSSASSHESDNEAEKHEQLDNDNEDDEDRHGDKEEGVKSAITWTEEDQKNLMDLGSSEIERNLRLESLILRRRARKNANMLTERNLIDLESLDFPFSIAPISTRRQNPFDHPHDPRDDSGLPPIPGSAPSVLVPRRNPFDIPYDSSEEKPNLLGDGFQEFTASQSREVFRRHESFNVRPSLFAQEGNDFKMRPYFVPERTISEESSYSQFQRQLSELSESKVSSVLETESISSVEDMKGRIFSEDDNSQKVEAIQRMKEGPSGNPEQILLNEECTEGEVHQERELTSISERVSEHEGHESESLDKRSSEDDELKFQLNNLVYHYQQESETRAVEVPETEYHSNSEDVGQRYRSSSSSSSLSEESERVFTEMESGVAKESGITTQDSMECTELSITSASVNDILQRGPVYDSSPREIGTNLPSSLISSDVHPELDPGFPPVLVKRTVSFVERESEGHHLQIEVPESSVADPLDRLRPVDVVDIRHHDSIHNDLPGIDQASDKALTKENIVEKHDSAEVPSSGTDDVRSFDEVSEDQNLDQQQEDKHLLISEMDDLMKVREPPSEGRPRTEHSIGSEDDIVESKVIDADVNSETEEKLISSAHEGDALIIHDKAIQELMSENSNEVRALGTPVKLFEDVPDIQEVDYGVSSNAGSPLSPDFTSFRSSTFEMAGSCSDLQTIVEEVDEIKEIDESMLSELDNVGDFSVNQWVSGLIEFETHGESARGSLMRGIEVNLVEESTIDDTLNKKIPSIGECVLSKMGLNESNSQDSPNQEVSRAVTLLEENEAHVAHSTEGDHFCTIPEVEVQSMKVADSVPKEADLASEERDIVLEVAEVSCQNIAGSGMPELEASTIEDINLAFQKISANSAPYETDLTSLRSKIPSGVSEVSYHGQVDSEEASMVEDINLAFKKIIADSVLNEADLTSVESKITLGVAEVSYQGEVNSWMPELEASTIEDINQAFKKISADSVPTETDLTSMETKFVLEVSEGSCQGQADSGMPELEASKIEDIDLLFKKISADSVPNEADLASVEGAITSVVPGVPHEGRVDSGMPELEASTIEDINLVFKKISADSVTTKANFTSVESKIASGVFEVSYQGQVDSGMPELEASTIEDIDWAIKKINAEATEMPVLQPAKAELLVGETITQDPEHVTFTSTTHEEPVLEIESIEDTIDANKLDDGRAESFKLPDSVDHTLQVVESEERLETSLKLVNTETVLVEGTTLPQKQESGSDNKKQQNIKSDDGSVEAKEDKIGSSVEVSGINEASDVTAEKVCSEINPTKDNLDSSPSVKGKGKSSKSSKSTSSNLSSSSESSSSDSDEE